mmetsp:Transcript_44710/g.142668  ORF Transcript_44710/g.142668 Transcript_44710/m.142668 type:complete len:361 (+) Transcript_44710:2303-3385(+)
MPEVRARITGQVVGFDQVPAILVEVTGGFELQPGAGRDCDLQQLDGEELQHLNFRDGHDVLDEAVRRTSPGFGDLLRCLQDAQDIHQSNDQHDAHATQDGGRGHQPSNARALEVGAVGYEEFRAEKPVEHLRPSLNQVIEEVANYVQPHVVEDLLHGRAHLAGRHRTPTRAVRVHQASQKRDLTLLGKVSHGGVVIQLAIERRVQLMQVLLLPIVHGLGRDQPLGPREPPKVGGRSHACPGAACSTTRGILLQMHGNERHVKQEHQEDGSDFDKGNHQHEKGDHNPHGFGLETVVLLLQLLAAGSLARGHVGPVLVPVLPRIFLPQRQSAPRGSTVYPQPSSALGPGRCTMHPSPSAPPA